jgi:hypothetical protein
MGERSDGAHPRKLYMYEITHRPQSWQQDGTRELYQYVQMNVEESEAVLPAILV